MKEVFFHNQAIEVIRNFPVDVRRETGKAIRDLQRGLKLTMPLSRPLPSVGIGVSEIRVRDRSGIYRTFYYSKSVKGIFVFHAFVKKTQKTPGPEIDLGRKRLREMMHEREN